MRFLHYAGLFLTLVVSAPLYAQTAGDDVNNSPVKQEQIQEILNNWRAHAGIPSAALSILLPGHDLPITFNSGTTVYGGRESVTADSLYQAGSITKSFTSAIILKLEAEGKLNINDPITRYLPQYPQWGNITVRQLLNHTSGIFNYTEAGLFNEIRKNPREGFTPEALVRIAEQHHNYFPPGRGWKYSNTNYVLAGMIIEKVTGQAMNNVMNYYLHRGFNINLGHTYFASGLYTSSLMSRMAHGYSTAGADATYDNMSWAYTVGGIVTTPQDLLSWWRGLFEEKVLPPAQLNEMMTLVCDAYSPDCMRGQPIPHIREDGAGKGYGLGIIQSGFGSEKIGTVWWHNGTTRGYEAIVMWFPKSDIYMALMISRAPGYLLKPTLPVIRHTLSVLIPDTEWHIAHPQQPHRYFTHHKHLEKHHHQARN
jgi:D-alanyl-D-alanine carboxypeptidase